MFPCGPSSGTTGEPEGNAVPLWSLEKDMCTLFWAVVPVVPVVPLGVPLWSLAVPLWFLWVFFCGPSKINIITMMHIYLIRPANDNDTTSNTSTTTTTRLPLPPMAATAPSSPCPGRSIF